MRNLLQILVLGMALCLPDWAATYVQTGYNWSFAGTPGGTCNIAGTVCTVSFSSPLTIGNYLLACYAAQSGTAPAQTFFSSITGASPSWNLNPSDTHGNNVEGYSAGQGHSTSCAWAQITTADSAIVVTRSGSGSNWLLVAYEVHSTGTLSLNFVGNTSGTVPSGGSGPYFYTTNAFTLTGNNIVFQMISAGAQETSCNSPYGLWVGIDHDAACLLLNSNNGGAAVFNSNQSAGFAASGLVLLEAGAAPYNSVILTGGKLTGGKIY